MKKKDVLLKYPAIAGLLKSLQRREVYKIKDITVSRRNYNDFLVQVTHFHKASLRLKVLATDKPFTHKRSRAQVGRMLQKTLPFGAPTDLNIVSIPYDRLGGLEFTRVPLIEIPLYMRDATPLYKRYLAEVQHAPEIQPQTSGPAPR